MLMHEYDDHPWEELDELLRAGDTAQAAEDLIALGHHTGSRALLRLTEEEQVALLRHLEPAESAAFLEEMPDAEAAQVLSHCPVDLAAAILSESRSNETADLLGGMEHDQARTIISKMDAHAAADARLLTRYEPDVAGGIMVTEYLSYPEHFTARQVVEDLHEHAEEYRNYDVQYSYVVDRQGKLVGVMPLRELVFTPGDTRIADAMLREPFSFNDETPLEQMLRVFHEQNYIGLPVLDDAGRLMGVARRRDVEAAASERNLGDYLKTQGIVSEELRSMPLLLRSRRRLSWLSVNIVLNVAAASVIAFFQDTLASVIALAVFLPIISDMSGCSGNQAVAVSMRELTLGLVKPFDALRVWGKEILVGLINGLALGLLIALVAWLWKGNPYLGLVVGAAMALNTMVAVSLGGVVPLVLQRFRLDPALASGPILTTVTDMCGFFFVLGFATLMLPLLT